ncbi:hypothetical protein K1Y72_15655 [Actinomadura sp. PM05-2]|uniref:Putative zinc-finger domain-containing protein n=2 Tax=Actinomadura parmotrematis TaxID=2864039 RepID=A0ABS7FTU0_9ACTN|nr:hypothetical protein [Actinomadura parmotrematis]
MDAVEAAALRAHLRRCPPCRDELAAFQRVAALLPRPRRRRGAGPSGTGASRARVNGACAAARGRSPSG